MDNFLDDEKLDKLWTKHYYHYLDNGYTFCEEDTFYKQAKQKISINSGLEKVSEKILKAMCYMYTKKKSKLLNNDMCKYFYYWLGNVLLNNIDNKIFTSSVLISLYGILNEAGVGIICEPLKSYIDKDNFKNIKLFFDYSRDYDTYRHQITDKNMPCNKKYNEHLQKYVDTYKTFQSECQDKPTSGYCKEFNEYFANKDSTKLSNWSCKLKYNKLEAKKAHGDKKEMEVQQLSASRIEQQRVNLPGELEGGIKQVEERHSSSSYSSSERTSDFINIPHPADVPSISGTTKTITTAVSAAGLLVPPFLVYNFTPVRSWINKLLGRNPIYRNPLTERELIENSYIPYHFDSERNSYNISYRPE